MSALRTFGLLAAALLLAGCAQAHYRTVPDGVVLPTAPAFADVGGIRTGGPVDPTCCWAGPDASFQVRKDAPATDLAVQIYIPKYATFVREQQGIDAEVEGRRLGSRCCFGPGLHTLLFRLPADVRERDGILRVGLRARKAFVPSREHVGPETVPFAYVLVSVSFGSYWLGRFDRTATR